MASAAGDPVSVSICHCSICRCDHAVRNCATREVTEREQRERLTGVPEVLSHVKPCLLPQGLALKPGEIKVNSIVIGTGARSL